MLRAAQLWLPAYLRQWPRRRNAPSACRHVVLCMCDHFEPRHATDQAGAMRRVAAWTSEYPKLAKKINNATGIRLRYTFFYPIEQYDPALLEPLADLCAQNLTEVEMHLHHDRDSPENLRNTLETAKTRMASLNMLSRDNEGAIRYAFTHGNWALANPHPKGRNCGVHEELQILQDTGCYADFTMPSAPHPAQSRMINSLYYAENNRVKRAHDRGVHAAVLKPGHERPPGLLLTQGPLMLNWRNRKFGLLPRLENSELAGNNPPTPSRMRLWLKAGIHVQGRPDWLFVKLHTHGCDEARGNMAMLLGQPMEAFLRHLAEMQQAQGLFTHIVTAREFVNIIRAAEQNQKDNPDSFRNFFLKPAL